MWKSALKTIRLTIKNPVVTAPLLLMAVLEFSCLALSYYMPRPPASYVLAPLVRAFAGEKFLHYPLNFLIIGRMVFIGRIFIYYFFGPIFLTMNVFFISQVYLGQSHVRFFGNLNRAIRLYPKILAVATVYALGALIAYKIPRIVAVKLLSEQAAVFPFSVIAFLGSFFLIVLIESILVFAPSIIALEKTGILVGIRKSISLFKKYFISVIFFVLSLRFLNLCAFFLKNNIPNLLKNQFPTIPEISLVILGLEISVLFLTTFLIFSTATCFFLSKEGHKND